MKTTNEISTPLLRRAKKVAAQEGVSLRTLVEEGLVATRQARKRTPSAVPPLVTFKVTGMNPVYATGGWEKIRDALYEGRLR